LCQPGKPRASAITYTWPHNFRAWRGPSCLVRRAIPLTSCTGKLFRAAIRISTPELCAGPDKSLYIKPALCGATSKNEHRHQDMLINSQEGAPK
jgi:hypothetical protein